ncbi:MAG: hypothetical protein K2X03_10655 [Bryobacteraceae bacterium]|nr:hypothetical protein [Bryobacteraceae bacterium]
MDEDWIATVSEVAREHGLECDDLLAKLPPMPPQPEEIAGYFGKILSPSSLTSYTLEEAVILETA